MREEPPPADRPKTAVQIRLLGDFHVSIDGMSISADAWTSRAAQLLQLLAMAGGHRLHRETVIETLFGHLDPEAGAANLRKAAHNLRRALGSQESVVLQRGEVTLCPTMSVAVDTAYFEQLADACVAAFEVFPATHERVAGDGGQSLERRLPREREVRDVNV
jgi:DNA-binding SARP family transcriptional activator